VRSGSRILRCSLLDVLLVAVPAFCVLVFTSTGADADLWGHLRFGADILRDHRLDLHDPYSFTSDTFWINHEWLAEVVLAAAYAAGGAAGLNILKLSVIAGICALVWRAARDEGARPFSATVLTGLVAFSSYTRTQVLRPQLFSVLCFAALLILLRRRERGTGDSPWSIAALFCLWANMHGGWIVGFAVLGLWSACRVVEQREWLTLRRRATEVAAALAATLVNPYGVGLWAFLRDTVGLERNISDWTPFIRFPVAVIAIEVVLPLLAAVALIRRRTLHPRHGALLAILAFGTYRVGRVDAFLQVAIGLLLAAPLVALLNEADDWLRARPTFTHSSPIHGVAAAGLTAAAVIVGIMHVGTIYIGGTWIPDPEAMKFLRTDAANTRLLTWFDWGEYAIWHLAPAGVRVSMDGRRETVYSERVLADHWDFYQNRNRALDYPNAIGADRIWLPRAFPVVPVLRERGWHVAYESDVSVVLSRTPCETRVSTPAPATGYFPGP
jgi:hypothetical protein